MWTRQARGGHQPGWAAVQAVQGHSGHCLPRESAHLTPSLTLSLLEHVHHIQEGLGPICKPSTWPLPLRVPGPHPCGCRGQRAPHWGLSSREAQPCSPRDSPQGG